MEPVLSAGRSALLSGMCAAGSETPEDRRRRLNLASVRRYRATPKGRAANARYNHSAKRLAVQARYNLTPKGRLTAMRYETSEAGIIMRKLRKDRRLYFRVYNSTRRTA